MYGIKKKDGYFLVIHNGKFEDTYISIEAIVDFINEAYDSNKAKVNIQKVFGIDGLEKSKFRDDQKEIYNPYMTSYIYEIDKKTSL